MNYTDVTSVIKGRLSGLNCELGQFCLIAPLGEEPNLYILNQETQEVEPVTVKGEVIDAWAEDEELLGDIHDIFVTLEEIL